MSARTHDIMNRLQQIGGTGKTVVEGNVNEFATVTVTSGSNPPVSANLVTDPAAGGYRFRAEVPVQTGTNNLTVSAKDRDTPTANTTTSNYTFTVAAATRTFEYDANGNMLADKTSGTPTRTFTWDAKNRLKSVLVASTTTTYAWDYDYWDRRIKEYETVGAGTKTLAKIFIWSGDELVQERNASNVITRTHHFGGFADGSTGATKYQTTTDHLGSVREVIVASGTTPAIGTVVTRYEYSTFQGPLAAVKLTGTNVNASFQTIGRYYHHAGSGLELAMYRGYDAELGRWVSEDPLVEECGLNLYGYVGNEVLSDVDKLGLANTGPYDGAPPPFRGSWKWFPDGANGRGGTWVCGKLSANWDAPGSHWDVDFGNGFRQRYNRYGSPLTVEAAHGFRGRPQSPIGRAGLGKMAGGISGIGKGLILGALLEQLLSQRIQAEIEMQMEEMQMEGETLPFKIRPQCPTKTPAIPLRHKVPTLPPPRLPKF